MTATDELCRMLDERKVKYDTSFGMTEFNGEDDSVIVACESMTKDGVLYVVSYLTPKQVIAATLGSGTCRIEHVKSGAMYDVWRCSECGYEYAERVDEEPIVQNYCPNCGRRTTEEDT